MRARFISKSLFVVAGLISSLSLKAQTDSTAKQFAPTHDGNMILLFILLSIVLVAAIFLKIITAEVIMKGRKKKGETGKERLNQYLRNMDSK